MPKTPTHTRPQRPEELEETTASMEETDPGPLRSSSAAIDNTPTGSTRGPSGLSRKKSVDDSVKPYELSEEGGLDENALDRLVWNLQDLNGGIRVILEALKAQNERHNAAEHHKQEFWSALTGSVHTIREVAVHLAKNRVTAVIIAAGIFIGIVSCSGVDPSDVDLAVEIFQQIKHVFPGVDTLVESPGDNDDAPEEASENMEPSTGASGVLGAPSAN